MSGYRTLHRDCVEEESERIPVWCIQCCSSSDQDDDDVICNVLASCGDGNIRMYQLVRKDGPSSTWDLPLRQTFHPTTKTTTSRSSRSSNQQQQLGSGAMHVIRNYKGQDRHAGDNILGSVRLDGHVSLWNITTTEVASTCSWKVPMASGVIFQFVLTTGCEYLVVAIGTLDNTLEFYSTGIPAPPHHKDNPTPPPAGTLLYTLPAPSSSSSTAIITSLAIAPTTTSTTTMAIGRSDGSFDIYQQPSSSWEKDWNRIHHHLASHDGDSSRIRAMNYTLDGQLLLVGNDIGRIRIYDAASSSSLPLVEDIHQAHSSIIFQITPCLYNPSKFLSCSADQTIRVWDTSTMPSQTGPIHTFDETSSTTTTTPNFLWDITTLHNTHYNTQQQQQQQPNDYEILTSSQQKNTNEICISCGNDGSLRIYSCNDK